MKRTILVAITMVMIFLLNGCLGAEDKESNIFQKDELQPVSSIILSEEDAQRLNEKAVLHLYFSSADGTKLVREIRYIDIDESKQETGQLASVIIRELLKGPVNTQLKPLIPEGTNLRSPVKLEGRTAVVDFTKEFVDNHEGGKELEELTIFSIVNSLTELIEIEKVKFTINGKSQKDFKGSFRFDNDFPRNEALIDRKQSQTALPSDLEEYAQDDTTQVNSDLYDEDEILE